MSHIPPDDSTPRRSARNQALPENEAEILNSLTGYSQALRCKALYDAGWTLRAIGESLQPPRSRSTVHTWIQHATPTASTTPISSPAMRTPQSYEKRSTPTKPIPSTDLATIRKLAPISRKYRSRLAYNHPATQANQALTLLCQSLSADGVAISDLAEAAEVSYRAMWKRVNS